MSARVGYRSVNNWGSGDLPAPYALGDVIDVPAGAKALERMNGMPPGRYKIVYGPSIDEGDAWYFRLAKTLRGHRQSSDRLHVAFADRCDPYYWQTDVDWLEGCTLVSTADPKGLALRERMIADGWKPIERHHCPSCGQLIAKPADASAVTS